MKYFFLSASTPPIDVINNYILQHKTLSKCITVFTDLGSFCFFNFNLTFFEHNFTMIEYVAAL